MMDGARSGGVLAVWSRSACRATDIFSSAARHSEHASTCASTSETRAGSCSLSHRADDSMRAVRWSSSARIAVLLRGSAEFQRQASTSVVHPALDGSFRSAQDTRDVSVLHAEHIHTDDRLAQIDRESEQSVTYLDRDESV